MCFTSSAFVYNLHLHRNLLCSHHMFYCNNFYYRTVGVLQARHPRARVASLVVDLARARVESQVVVRPARQATGDHPTSGVSLGYYYPYFFLPSIYFLLLTHMIFLSFLLLLLLRGSLGMEARVSIVSTINIAMYHLSYLFISF